MATKKQQVVDTDNWIAVHFEEIVERFAGQHIVVSNGEIFTGKDAIDKARKKYPAVTPASMPVPRPEDFVSILKCKKLYGSHIKSIRV